MLFLKIFLSAPEIFWRHRESPLLATLLLLFIIYFFSLPLVQALVRRVFMRYHFLSQALKFFILEHLSDRKMNGKQIFI